VTVHRVIAIVALTALAAAIPAVARAQAQPSRPDLATLSIEQLLEVELTSTASKFSQEVTRAPASVTVVTAGEIRERGYRSFAEILSSVRGIYTTNDRNYTYIGVRGFARPGDYNTRVLLLIDGHRMNEPIYNMSSVGHDFPIDVSWIERVEVIRGPGSSLYGANAFFAVINVITRTAAAQSGVRVQASTGSLATHGASASVGRVTGSGNEFLLGVSGRRSAGETRLYFPELAALQGNDTAVDADDEQAASVFASASIGSYQFRGAFIDRSKRIPTGSFGTVFGDRRERTEDRRMFADVAHASTLAGWTSVARGGFDFTAYAGQYPYDYGMSDAVLQRDASDSAVLSGELTLNRRWRGHLLTVGSEFRRDLHNHQWTEDDVNGRVLDESHQGNVLGLYLQDELTLRRWLLLNAGARFDYDSSYGGRATPRAGLVFLPRRQSAVKLLYGQAYRAPNSYELHYYTTMRERRGTLEPETIATTEAVWEEYIGPHLRTGLSIFHYDANGLIEQRSLPYARALSLDVVEDRLYFANAGRSSSLSSSRMAARRWGAGASRPSSSRSISASKPSVLPKLGSMRRASARSTAGSSAASASIASSTWVSNPCAPPVNTAGRRVPSVSPRPCQRERMPHRYRAAIRITPAASSIQRSSFIESGASLRDSHGGHADGFVDVDRDEP